MKTKNSYKYVYFFLLFLILFFTAIIYTICTRFAIHSFEQVLFHVTQPMDKAAPLFVEKIAHHTIIETVAALVLVFLIMAIIHVITVKPGKKLSIKYFFTMNDAKYMEILQSTVYVCLFLMLAFVIIKLKMFAYVKNLTVAPTNYYQENYVYPTTQNVKFPRKNNLIIIHMESIEKTYFNRKIFKEDLLPHLKQMSSEYMSFSGNRQVLGSEWTTGGIFSGYCGIPLKTVIAINEYGRLKSFFSNVTCLTDLLKENGYRTYYMQGGDIKFAGKNSFMSQHGVDDIYGADRFYQRADFNKTQKGAWGVNDHALFGFVKEKLLEIAKDKSPFYLGILTVDTHHPDGFQDPVYCSQYKYDIKLKNVLACTDQMLYDFVEWLKTQNFFKNTTIILIGDHYAMPNDLKASLAQEPNREVVNIFINPVKKTNNLNRTFCMIDFMPTIIESMGGVVEGGRLGLGTSLFCGKKTLMEEQGYDLFNASIYAKNLMYEKFR